MKKTLMLFAAIVARCVMGESTVVTNLVDGCYYVDGEFVGVDPTAKRIVFPNGLKDVASECCADNTNLCEVIIPPSVVSLNYCCFYRCVSLTNIVLAEGLTYIGRAAFAGCSSLQALRFPSSLSYATAPFTWYSSDNYEALNLKGLYFKGSPPGIGHSSALAYGFCYGADFPEDMVFYVSRKSTGWGTPSEPNVLPERWPLDCAYADRRRIMYDPDEEIDVQESIGFVNIITEIKGGGAKGLAIPSTWATNYIGFVTMYGKDFTAALTKKSGKQDACGKDLYVWQDYVAGTDPTKKSDQFKALITMNDDVPEITIEPTLSESEADKRLYKTLGKKQLQDSDWTDLTNADGETLKNYNFFKVTVEMK